MDRQLNSQAPPAEWVVQKPESSEIHVETYHSANDLNLLSDGNKICIKTKTILSGTKIVFSSNIFSQKQAKYWKNMTAHQHKIQKLLQIEKCQLQRTQQSTERKT